MAYLKLKARKSTFNFPLFKTFWNNEGLRGSLFPGKNEIQANPHSLLLLKMLIQAFIPLFKSNEKKQNREHI
ncbi:hypothetical protein DJ013_07750 [Arcticibacterium luteifluviistationis]|uniref:Uncharacterized protein n=1 Tax=Arcticibacterium luteifluviistationis TaxID=1784714 RepID=A0A2Z4GA31_9BACT|nr:hypothetical protein DJ013_07750 [Arcticibacterium luteifluviistationis]